MAKRTLEPFIWLLFSGGGMVAALALPALIVLFAFALPLGWVSPPDLPGLLRNPLVRIGLLGICALALVHAAHRFRFTLEDGLQLHRYDRLIATACYGAALVGAALAAYLLILAL